MSYHLHLQTIKNRIRQYPTQIQLEATHHNRVKMQYLLEQYDRQNQFLNKQIRELINQNKKLKNSHHEHLKTEAETVKHSRDLLSKQQIRERYSNAILGSDKVRYTVNKTISQYSHNHGYNPYDTYHREKTSKQHLIKGQIYSFADKSSLRTDGKNKYNDRDRLNSTQMLDKNKQRSVNQVFKYSQRNQKTSSTKKRINPEIKQPGYRKYIQQKRQKYDYKYNNPYVSKRNEQQAMLKQTPATVPPITNSIGLGFNRDPYLNQNTEQFIQNQSQLNTVNFIEIGRKSRSKSRQQSPKKQQNIGKISRNGSQLYKNISQLGQKQQTSKKQEVHTKQDQGIYSSKKAANPLDRIPKSQLERVVLLQQTPAVHDKSFNNSSYLDQKKAFTVDTNYSPNVNRNSQQYRKNQESLRRVDSLTVSQHKNKTERNFDTSPDNRYNLQNITTSSRPNTYIENAKVESHNFQFKIQEPKSKIIAQRQGKSKEKRKFLSVVCLKNRSVNKLHN